ncbi:MAG: subtilisin, partial [Flavobacteriaceae bacterium]
MKKITFVLKWVLCFLLFTNLQAQVAETSDGVVNHSGVSNLVQGSTPFTGTYYSNSRALLIYDNGPLINMPPDKSVLETSLGMNGYGFGAQTTANNRMADDLILTNDYDITSINFYAYQTGSTTTSTLTGVTLRVWDGVPGAMGSSVVWGDATTNVLGNTSFTGVFRVLETSQTATNRPIMEAQALTSGLTLTAGTYWLDWNFSGSLASGPWQPPIVILGTTTTGNGLQSINGGPYNPAVDGGSGAQQGLPFQVFANLMNQVNSCATDTPQPLGPGSGVTTL